VIKIDKEMLIRNSAYELFKKNGYKKTNISMITKKAGIATGSFYNYFNSKEDIFLKVYIYENNILRANINDNINWDLNPLVIIQEIFKISFESQTENKILSEWNNKDINYFLKNYYSSEEGKKDYPFHELLKNKFSLKLKQMNFEDKKIDIILSTFELIYLIDMQLDHSELKDYNKTFQFLIENFVRGLF